MAPPMPQQDPVAEEILHRYADVIRLGSLRVNGGRVTWDAGAGTAPARRLEAFGAALGEALRLAPGAEALADEALCAGAVYWLCKALSINYAMAEVLHLLKRKVGAVCSIDSWNGQGAANPVEYIVEAQPGPMLRVGILWSCKGNLVTYDPYTSEKQVKGTISRVETEFPLPPEPGFTPEYHVEMELCKAERPRLPAFACQPHVEHADLSFERVVLAAPLRRTLPRDELRRHLDLAAIASNMPGPGASLRRQTSTRWSSASLSSEASGEHAECRSAGSTGFGPHASRFSREGTGSEKPLLRAFEAPDGCDEFCEHSNCHVAGHFGPRACDLSMKSLLMCKSMSSHGPPSLYSEDSTASLSRKTSSSEEFGDRECAFDMASMPSSDSVANERSPTTHQDHKVHDVLITV